MRGFCALVWQGWLAVRNNGEEKVDANADVTVWAGLLRMDFAVLMETRESSFIACLLAWMSESRDNVRSARGSEVLWALLFLGIESLISIECSKGEADPPPKNCYTCYY